MGRSQSVAAAPLPLLLRIILNVAILGFLLSVAMMSLAARSGPWLTAQFGPTTAEGPKFATIPTSNITDHFLNHVGMSHNYHFISNQPAQTGVYFEVALTNKLGEETHLAFPQKNAHFWVRHRQKLLAAGLANDAPVMPQELMAPERVGAQGSGAKVEYWLLPNEVRKLFSLRIPHGAFVVEAPSDGPLVPKDKKFSLELIGRFYPLLEPPENISELIAKGKISAPFYVIGDSLVAAEATIPLLEKAAFYRARPKIVQEWRVQRIIGAPIDLATQDPESKKSHYYRFAVSEDQKGALRSVVSNRPMISRPDPWALILAKSYMRHLCREHKAVSAKLTRHSRQAIQPAYMYFQQENQLPPDAFSEMIAHFGNLEKE